MNLLLAFLLLVSNLNYFFNFFLDESEANEFYTKVTECRSTPPQRMINQALAPPISSRPISPPPPSSPPSSSYAFSVTTVMTVLVTATLRASSQVQIQAVHRV